MEFDLCLKYLIIYFVIEKYTLELVLYRNIKSNHHGACLVIKKSKFEFV
ncbi:hypothetical protein NADRNF5_0931 [Nitrosopumilus adriaticus]|uniref:Uncharacterized protein n=1 Tax=Nitrosopumilus adriaticus TaxID=1580092 RepID=A0A0D5C2Q8_9ARCH|nr:hypothetical protein NADRNF5_0931 [Nitrosopumilus adriaticus]